MPLTYADAAALLFGSRPFTSREFAARTGSRRAAKVLSALKSRGLVERLGRGRYRVLGPDERPDLRAVDARRVRAAIRLVDLPKAFAGSTAVGIWTAGAYTVSPSVLTEELELLVPGRSLRTWRRRLRERGVRLAGRKRLGVSVRLIPVKRMPPTAEVDGERVIGRREVVRLIREHPGLYGGAEEWLVGRPRRA